MFPTILDPIIAIHKLKHCQKTLSPAHAIAYLEEQLLNYQLQIIYQHFFPTEFDKSRASMYPRNLKEAEFHTPSELELFHLIDENLFPLNAWYHTEIHKERLYTIPLTPLGIDWQEEGCDMMNLKPSWLALMALSSNGRRDLEPEEFDEEYEKYLESEYSSIIGIAFQEIAPPEKINEAFLQEKCASSEHPLNLLPLALRLLDHTTGNFWLDLFSYELEEKENEIQFSWTIESIEFLTTSYQESEKIWEQVNQLINWLEADLITNFKQVIKVWNLSSHPT